MDNAPAATTMQSPQSGVAAGFNRLGIFRQIGLMIGLAASIAIGFAVVLWSQEPEYRPLLTNLDSVDASQIIQTLQTSQIKYNIDTNTGVLMVEASQIHNARLKLAAEGLSGKDNVGFELLDQESALGTSQFMETTRFKRGLEGELARTISSLLSVKSARVHLALPKESVFVRDSRKPTASVFVQLYAGRSLNKVQVASISNLVASSIPELDPKDVTVVDQKGQLLNRQDVDEEVAMVARQLDYIRKVEDRLAQRVRGILEPVVGNGRFKAEVAADVDFTAIEQTDELYNPDLPALRSEQSLEENRASAGGAGGVPGALANQPPGAGAVPEVGAPGLAQAGGIGGGQGASRSQTTRNFELDRTISYTRHQQGRVQRLTVAVAVDDLMSIDANGEVSRAPWTDEDLQRLTVLVRDAVGYSAARGDSVNVVNAAFASPEPIEALPEMAIWEQGWFWDVMKSVGAVLFLLILVFGVLRPILKSLSTAPVIEVSGAGSLDELDGIPESDTSSSNDSGNKGAGAAMSDENMLPGPNESYERQLAAVRSLVAEDPGRVAQVVKRWVASDE